MIHYTASEEKKKYSNEWKVAKVHVYVQCFSLSFQGWEDLLNLTLQLDTIVIEVSSVKVLRQIGDPRRIYGTSTNKRIALGFKLKLTVVEYQAW